MSNPSHVTWSDNQNPPQISYYLRRCEILEVIGGAIGAILYGTLTHKPTCLCSPCYFTLGVVIALFFECMTALLNPDNRMRRRVKWVFVIHTVGLFLSITISSAIEGIQRSNAYVDNREYPGVNNVFSSGPFGYLDVSSTSTVGTIEYAAFPLNQWLTDGLLVSVISSSKAYELKIGGFFTSFIAATFSTP